MLPTAVQDVFGQNDESITRYVDILASRGIDWGLIGPREADKLWDRHVLNSVALVGLVGQGARVVDVGSGAGLPGIPLAIARPDLSITLLEPLLRRFTFLTEVVEELGLLDRVTVLRGRAEDLRSSFDVVTARAVAPLGKLVGWTRHLITPNGELLALKGESAAEEIRDAASVLRDAGFSAQLLTVQVVAGMGTTHVVRVRPVASIR